MKFLLLACFAACLSATAQTNGPLLLQSPTISSDSIVFHYAGDLWITARTGGDARRLTNGAGSESNPIFSPDGKMVAFTGEYDGNVDVFVVPASGGVPKRLTYHPAPDTSVGWTPDSKSIIFRSPRANATRGFRLFSVPIEGGFPTELPFHQAFAGSLSSDQTRIAYVPLSPAFRTWKMYRGGGTTPIWIASLADSRIEQKIPRENSNDFNPIWLGNEVFFLSDRNGPVSLYKYNLQSKRVATAVANTGLDIKNASYGGGLIVYEQFGGIYTFDPKTSKSQKVPINVNADLPELRARVVNVGTRAANGRLSPNGARAVFAARGDIFTVPAEKGDPRNLTQSSGVNDRFPAWSPDGKSIAYFSDESGEYELHVRNQNGQGDVKKIKLDPDFYLAPEWSPDSKKIAFIDQLLNYWYLDVESGTAHKIDTDVFNDRGAQQTATWSSDSRWLAYAKSHENRLRTITIYSLEDQKATPVTDGMSDARSPVFDKSGKYLYFTASTDIGPSIGDGLAAFGRTVTRSVYVAVLRKDLPSPLAPESDEEKDPDAKKPEDPVIMPADAKSNDSSKPAEAKADDKSKPADLPKPGASKPPAKVTIDFANISQRILALPIPPKDLVALHAGKANLIFIVERPAPAPGAFLSPVTIIHKFDLEKRKLDKVIEGVSGFTLSSNGEKMLFSQTGRWTVASTSAPLKPGEGQLKMQGMEMRVDPVAEWNQIYREVWRYERDFFYDPGLHGYNLADAKAQFSKYLPAISSRDDLNYLMTEMLRDMRTSHLFIGGGDSPDVKRVSGGLLGADYKLENGRYRFAKILQGESWTPELRAPLTQPGVNVAEGEYLIAVNGRNVKSTDNIYSYFESTAGKSVLLKVGANPDGSNSRDVTVVPIPNDSFLRNLDWVANNRRKVDKMTNGRVAYVYLPDTFNGGYTSFNRYFYSQIGKKAVIFDERSNAGGMLADYIVESANRKLLSMGSTRGGKDFTVPHSIYGPKVMLINEYAGSGGDAMPYYFRELGLGPLIGKRTWGGLVRGGGPPPLLDGGFVSAPDAGLYNNRKEWIGENKGIAPDIEVEDDPADVRGGRDPQLEKSVEIILKALDKNEYPEWQKPGFTRQDRSVSPSNN